MKSPTNTRLRRQLGAWWTCVDAQGYSALAVLPLPLQRQVERFDLWLQGPGNVAVAPPQLPGGAVIEGGAALLSVEVRV